MVPWSGQCPCQWAFYSEGSLVLSALCKWSADIVEGVWGQPELSSSTGRGGRQEVGEPKLVLCWGEHLSMGEEKKEGWVNSYTLAYIIWGRWVSSPLYSWGSKGWEKSKYRARFKLRSVAKVCVQSKHAGRNYCSMKSLGEIRRWDFKEFPTPCFLNSLYMIKLLLCKPLTLGKVYPEAPSFVNTSKEGRAAPWRHRCWAARSARILWLREPIPPYPSSTAMQLKLGPQQIANRFMPMSFPDTCELLIPLILKLWVLGI